MNLRAIVGNPKTTIAAVVGLIALAAVVAQRLLDGDPATTVDWSAVVLAATPCVGLLFSRDGDKSSEDVGVK